MGVRLSGVRALRRLRQRIDDAAPRTLRRWLGALVFLALWGLITHGNNAGTGDEPHYLMIAHSLVFDRDLDLANDYADGTNLVADGKLQPERHAIPGRDGLLRPVHDIGMPLAFSPYFAAAYLVADRVTPLLPDDLLRRAKLNPALVLRHLMSFGMMALAALLATMLFDTFLETSGRKALAFGWALLVALSPPLLSHSFLFFTEIPSALVALFIWRGLTRLPVARPWPLVYGFLTGGLLLIHVRNVGLVGALLILAAWAFRAQHERRAALLFATGFALTLGLRTWTTYVLWGSFVTTPHAAAGSWLGFGPNLSHACSRLLALGFDSAHGLLLYGPLHLLWLAGLVVAWRNARATTLRMLIPPVLYLACVTLPLFNPYGWRGGWSPAARYLVPVLPFVALLAFQAVAALRRWPWALRVLVSAQCALAAYYWQHPRLLWNDEDGHSALVARWSSPGWDWAVILPNWQVLDTTQTAMLCALVALWLVATAGLALRALRAQVSAGGESRAA